ncbi:hypothetical protein M6D93_01570 [Jatrophihabitans telluris]|uniref:Uncharacterized protein n=1 Tax=Jatrophihabitans telluris TaxID=2038343 RepID=A0ABY4R0W5_9ACTN|nr:hypothetical protein [Jatrophihabitans telluris]UQX88704.1 hypothetical protein M6D93_01570 [Jatrophihabitans telluris]
MSSLTDVLTEIIDLLGQSGRPDKAAWLQERKLLLQRSDVTDDAREHVTTELHAVVLGMGGLMDLSLAPEPGSSFTAASARERLDALGDTLYDLTR